jgi:hypothetical protein
MGLMMGVGGVRLKTVTEVFVSTIYMLIKVRKNSNGDTREFDEIRISSVLVVRKRSAPLTPTRVLPPCSAVSIYFPVNYSRSLLVSSWRSNEADRSGSETMAGSNILVFVVLSKSTCITCTDMNRL